MRVWGWCEAQGGRPSPGGPLPTPACFPQGRKSGPNRGGRGRHRSGPGSPAWWPSSRRREPRAQARGAEGSQGQCGGPAGAGHVRSGHSWERGGGRLWPGAWADAFLAPRSSPAPRSRTGPWPRGKRQHWELRPPAQRRRGRLTGGASVEVVVVLRHVGQDTQPVRHLQGDHVLRVQQGRDAQLLLRHTEGLGGGGAVGGQRRGDPRPGQAPSSPEGGREGPGAGAVLGARKGLGSRLQLCSASVYPTTLDCRGREPVPVGSW